jgi:hypothetical protein
VPPVADEEIADEGPRRGVFATSMAAGSSVERALMRTIYRTTIMGIPLAILLFVGLLAVAIGDQVDWYVLIVLGTFMGLVAAALFGMLFGVTLTADALDELDRDALRRERQAGRGR